jgi:ADP-ribosylglycohydrolase
MAVDNRIFDVGIQTRQAIVNLKSGTPPEQAGPHHERANGNGALMRALPPALWHRSSDAELVTDARRQSLVTHGHLRAQLCCALYCLWARRELEGHAAPYDDALAQRLAQPGTRRAAVGRAAGGLVSCREAGCLLPRSARSARSRASPS